MGTFNLNGVSSNVLTNLNKYSSGYKKNKEVEDAQNYLNTVQANKPKEFQSLYSKQMEDLYKRVQERPKFQYDMNADMLYNQYKDQYQVLGKAAMADTIGQASALTGGYGSSYAETAGMNAYQNYLQQLNDKLPQLYQIARDNYNQDGEQLLNQYNMAKDMHNTDYNKYRDSVADWHNERNYASDDYNRKYTADYNQYKDMLSYWADMAIRENANYWDQANYNYRAQQDALAMALEREKFEFQKQQSFNSGGSGGGRSYRGRSSAGRGKSSKNSSSSGTSGTELYGYPAVPTAFAAANASNFKTRAVKAYKKATSNVKSGKTKKSNAGGKNRKK